MRLTATDIYHLHQPSVCELRVYLKHRAEPEAEPSEYDRVLQELGARHERNHLSSLGPLRTFLQELLRNESRKQDWLLLWKERSFSSPFWSHDSCWAATNAKSSAFLTS